MNRQAATSLPRPGVLHGRYPERRTPPAPLWLDLADRLGQCLSTSRWRASREQQAFLAELDRIELRRGAHDLPALAASAAATLAQQGFSAVAVARAIAVIGKAIALTQGRVVFRTQQLAAHALLGDRLVEMATGEGKTLALLMAAGTAALAGVPTHVISANEYLAERDAQAAQPVLAALGLSAAAVRNHMSAQCKRDAYAQPVVYVSAQELGFDHLRDRLHAQSGSSEPPLLRGLCFALVDEADSVLLDHSRTPLVLATHAPQHAPEDTVRAVYALGRDLQPDRDWRLDAAGRRAWVTPECVERLRPSLMQAGLNGDLRVLAQALDEALTARHALHCDVDYVVIAGEVMLIDPTTGRVRPGSVWSRGLHGMVCVKEGLPAPQSSRTVAQTTLQALLQRYCKLAGISGTLRDSAWQLWVFYRLETRRIEPRVPSLRRDHGLRLFATRAAQFDAVCASVLARSATGQPVLVGADSIATADALSARLAAAGIAHACLTARDDRSEAALVARAGTAGAVTVATNMAGRGTDIVLDAMALSAGGLHVICCTQNASSRIDRQLFGRAARNGQPGSTEALLSLDDRSFVDFFPASLLSAWRCCADSTGELPRMLGRLPAGVAQALAGYREFLRSWRATRNERLSSEALGPAAPQDL